jgi:hypothetical protein
MMTLLKQLKRFFFIASLFSLCGCEWMTPVDAEQTFEVIKGQDIRVSYSGVFDNYCEEIIALMAIERSKKDENIFNSTRCIQDITTRMEKVFAGPQVKGSIKVVNRTQHQVEYHAKFDRLERKNDADLICLRNGIQCGNLRVGSFADVRAGEKDFELVGNDEAYQVLDSVLKVKNDKSKPKNISKLFQKVEKKVALTRQRLVVHTDLYVTSHNASNVTSLLNGVKEYRWVLLANSPRPSLKAVHDETH